MRKEHTMEKKLQDITLEELYKIQDLKKISEIVEEIHPVDFLEELEEYEGDLSKLLSKLPDDYLVLLIDEAEIEEKLEIFETLSDVRKAKIITDISSDELVDMIQEFHEDEIESILEHLEPKDQAEIREMLTYDKETAGGIMATEFLRVRDTMSMDETIDYLRTMAPDYETPYYVYVIDDDSYLKGVVQLRQILTCPPDTLVKDEMVESVIAIDVNTDQEDVARQFEKYGFAAMPVIDNIGKMIGIITFDDILPIITEEHTEDMYRLAGLDEEEEISGSVLSSVKSRIFWLILNLFTAILAATVIGKFEDTIATIVALATLMPIVSGMGGNSATQTLTLIIRAIALDDIDSKNVLPVLIKEITVGLIDGIIVGILLGIITYFWIGNFYLSLIIMFALVFNIIISAIVGTMVPIILKKLGTDPALASSVFVTTFTDCFGFGIFLSLATVFMDYLI